MNELSERKFSIPSELETHIVQSLGRLNVDLKDVSRISESILRLSDFYIHEPQSPTPWKDNWAQIAYLSYFLPLNFLRARAVIDEGSKLGFFNGLRSLIDFGSGLGSGSLSLDKIPEQLFIERSRVAQELHASFLKGQTFHRAWQSEPPPHVEQNTLSIFSYSLTELSQLPEWALESEALMIIEPATRDDGRKLLKLRSQLMIEGFHIWAPCTHQGACPLLTQSKTDWCHDRIHFEVPPWFQKIEQHLPMKNSTLTTSYLLARRSLRPTPSVEQARTVGDQVKEKGKTRQLVCRGPEREFLTWMERDWGKAVPRVPRGVLIEWPDEKSGAEKKSNEVRLKPKSPGENK